MSTPHSDHTLVLLPKLLANHPSDDGVTLTLSIPENLVYFDGHFDVIAVVPGVVQIQWAVKYARQFLSANLTFSHMDAIKFKDLLLPGQQLQLVLGYQPHTGRLEFCYRTTDDEFSSGRIYFHEHLL